MNMTKRTNLCTVLFLAIAIMFAGCKKDKYDDAELQKRIAELEEQKKKVDEQQKQIAELQEQQKDFEALVAALGDNAQITSITQNSSGTVTVTFADGNTITIPGDLGDGTATNPRKIFNAEGLDAMRNNLDWHYILVADITVTNWLPVGDWTTVSNVFSGSFDGNGHTVTINSFGVVPLGFASCYFYGLFGSISSGTVNRLNVVINAAPVNRDGIIRYGGITGTLEASSLISNCSVSGALLAATVGSYPTFVGGIAGSLNVGAMTQNCYALGSVSATGGGNNLAGGITGNATSSTISACAALQTAITGSASYSGRVAGSESFSTVADSYANKDMQVNGNKVTTGTVTNINGADCEAQPAASWWQNTSAPNLGWDWSNIWEVANGGYPKLR